MSLYKARVLRNFSLNCTQRASRSPVVIDWSKVDKPDAVFQPFASRRSVVYGIKGIVSSSQPLATEAGLEILRKGGNAGIHDCALQTVDLILISAMLSRRCCRNFCRFEHHRA
jgi:hypothetical protein